MRLAITNEQGQSRGRGPSRRTILSGAAASTVGLALPVRRISAAATFWWDTLQGLPGETSTIGFVAGNPGKWMLHCHMLDHQASGMDAWFEVG